MTVGLEALVTTTLEGYERLAIELGNAPERLREIRRALALEAPRSSLFNAAQYTKDLEQVFLHVYALQTRKKAEILATPV
jgi:predicted O-linked N-acetylglucosamine transferase (SPINDLY family)